LHIGILTGGGDAPGLNAVIRAVVRTAAYRHGWRVTGIENAFNGLLPELRKTWPLHPADSSPWIREGGTILGTTNRGDPFHFLNAQGEPTDRSPDVADAVKELGLDVLICLGGDGTQRIAWRLMEERGVPVIGVPKTIDNDLPATDLTFGFHSAVAVATDALDRLHDTAESHDRVMFLEVMGRDAGHIALAAGIAGGADVILIPELPYRPPRVASKILRRRAIGRAFSIVVVAEGALPVGAEEAPEPTLSERHARLRAGGGASAIAMRTLQGMVDADMRRVVLGHIQRGGSPIPFDRILATRFGVAAAELARAGRWGEMVALVGPTVEGVPMQQATASVRTVDLGGGPVRTARALGIELGDD